ncbi:MAG TPA: two-component regulator propeller domain-containing protein, partial [Puia sp.]|nr:two-component regulator propeller domain-containing protein [Puia sp.]
MSKIFLPFVFSLSATLSIAQQSPQRIRFEHLTVADGLPANEVRCMIQDHLGFIWLGTQLGLVRYDGDKMTLFPYAQGNLLGCRGKNIGVLMEDPQGDIWIGAENLIRFERATQRFIEYPDKNGGDYGVQVINSFHQDKQGFIWTTRWINRTEMLSRFDPKTNTWVYFSNDPHNPHYLEGNGIYRDGFVEDRDGKIWVITLAADGNILQSLDRSSGKFIPCHPKIGPAMTEDFKKIMMIATDGQGTLYLSSYNNGSGLFSLNPGTGEVKHVKHDAKEPKTPQSDTTLSIFPDKKGFLWITHPKGIDRYEPRTNIFTHYISKPGDLSTPGAGFVNSFYETTEGDIWFDTSQPSAMNFYKRSTNSFTRYELDEKQEDALWGDIESILVDRAGVVWMASNGMGINKESRTSQFPLLKNIPGKGNGLQDFHVTSVYESPSEPGIIWFGTRKGLDRYDRKNGKYTHYKHDDHRANSLSKETVTATVEDNKGRFWVSTIGGGLNLMDRKKGTFFHFVKDSANTNRISTNNVFELTAVADGTLWIGTPSGLDHFDYDNNKFTHYQGADTTYTSELFDLINQYTTPDRTISAIIHPTENVDFTNRFDLAGPTDLLVTGMGEINSASVNISDHGWIEDISGKIIWDMDFSNTLGDGNGRIKAGTIHLNKGSYRLRYKSDKGYSYGHWIRAAPLHAELWGIQVTKVSPREAQLFNIAAAKRTYNGLGDSRIYSITEDSKKNIWIGSDQGGVDKYDPATGKFVSFAHRSTGPECAICIVEDKKTGNFWVGDHLYGLLLMSPKGETLKTFSATNGLPSNSVNRIEIDPTGIVWFSTDNGLCRLDPATGKIQHYNQKNGLPELRFNSAGGQTADGKIYFVSEKGASAFYPAQIKMDDIAPLLALTDLDINGRPAIIGKDGQMPMHISVTKDIELTHDLNELTFHFTSLLFNRGSESQFAYRLSPIDQDWVNSGTIRQARYNNLSPGDYTFTVKAANAEGVWNETGTSITIRILPPWWRTWWAYVLYVLVAAGSIYGFIAYRSAALRKENKILEDKVELRTNQLQTSIENLKATQSQLIQSEKMASLGELTAGIAHEIQNPLNFVNNFSDVNTELIEEAGEEIDKGNIDDAKIILNDIKENEQKINHHGKR